MEYTKRQRFEILRSELEGERASFLPVWRDAGDYINPMRPRFAITDVNKGDRRNQKIIDSTATLAMRTLSSGMMSGVTSPARPWFRLTVPNLQLAETGAVKQWLHEVGQLLTTVFLRSNLYNVLPIIYSDMGTFGTAALMVEEDLDDVLRFYPFPIGSYMIANDARLKVNVFMREFRMTVRQVVEKFLRDPETGKIDWDKATIHVKNHYDKKQLETWIDIVHVIMPNDEYDPGKIASKYKKFTSCYYEKGSSSGNSYLSQGIDDNRFLSEKGYDYFPVLCPRWQINGEDVYGRDCPGITAIGDIKQLQLGERRIMQAIEKMVNPPMTGPTELKQSKVSMLPGDITYLNVREGQQGFKPAHEVNARIDQLEGKQQQCRSRIQRAMFEDLFLMLASSDRREITAREIDERHEEKLLALGPVLEQLNQDLLDPLIDIAFEVGVRQRLFPPPPEEIQGQTLKVEYVSVMAQAQKMVGISALERFAGFASQVATVQPEALDKIDTDQILDVYADAVSVAPNIVRTDEQVAQIRDARAKAQQAQMRAESINMASQSAKNLSQTSMEGDNALNRIVDSASAGSLTGTV